MADGRVGRARWVVVVGEMRKAERSGVGAEMSCDCGWSQRGRTTFHSGPVIRTCDSCFGWKTAATAVTLRSSYWLTGQLRLSDGKNEGHTCMQLQAWELATGSARRVKHVRSHRLAQVATRGVQGPWRPARRRSWQHAAAADGVRWEWEWRCMEGREAAVRACDSYGEPRVRWRVGDAERAW